MVTTHAIKKKQEIIKANTHTYTKEITSISAESYTQKTYCQMHYISYCMYNIHQL